MGARESGCSRRAAVLASVFCGPVSELDFEVIDSYELVQRCMKLIIAVFYV